MSRSLLLFAPLVLLAACGRESEAAPLEEAAEAAPPAEGEWGAGAAHASALKVSESNDVYTFDYSYPAAASGIAPLRALLDQRMEEKREAHIAMAIDARADADEGGYPFNPYGSGTEWLVVANLPDWLSLSANVWEFTGGAHGNYWFDTLLWDKQAGEVKEPLSLFSSTEELESVVQKDLCRLLDLQRRDKRGEPVQRDSGYGTECIGLTDVTVILGSTNRRTFDRIGFLIPPYVAGPYAEGSYEVTLPVSQAIIDVAKPEYRSSFSVVS